MARTPKRSAGKSGKVKSSRRRGARGILWLIAVTLALSGLLRLGGETGMAIAKSVATVAGGEDRTEPESCTPPEDIATVLSALQERERRIEAREAALADRMQALSVAETQVEKNLAALREAEASLEATMARTATASEDDLARLTAVYENMKPKEAAALFAAMDPQFAAGFLGRMRADAAAPILAGLAPDAAYSISVILAGRNADAPKD